MNTRLGVHRLRTWCVNDEAPATQGKGREGKGREKEGRKDGSVDHHLSVSIRLNEARFDDQNTSIGGHR